MFRFRLKKNIKSFTLPVKIDFYLCPPVIYPTYIIGSLKQLQLFLWTGLQDPKIYAICVTSCDNVYQLCLSFI